MRILVDCCNYFLDNNNNGDRALYKTLAMRLTRFWPDAEISWITLDPELIRQTIPNVTPFTLKQRHHWELFICMQSPRMPGLLGTVSSWWGRSFPIWTQRFL